MSKKFAVIGDIHFGIKDNYEKFIEYQIDSYLKIINEIKSKGLKTVVILGDVTDNRKSINYNTLNTIRKHFIDPSLNYIIVCGNHDTYYKNTNSLNSLRQLFSDYDNVTIVDTKPLNTKIEGIECIFVPWITEDNETVCMDMLEATKATHCFGHFPISGALMTKGIVCNSSLHSKFFEKFETVISGHFHLTQLIKNFIHYIGSMCQLDWNDYGDTKQYMVVGDKMETINLVDDMFIKININDEFKFENLEQYKDKFISIER